MLGQAVHVLDRFHVMKQFGKALDDIRTAEVAKLALLHNLGHLPEPKRTHRFC